VPDKQVFRQGFEGLKAYMHDRGDDAALRAEIANGKKWEIYADAGAIITTAFVTAPKELADLNIEPGKVRVALPIKSRLTPGGLRPGMKVDIAAPMLTSAVNATGAMMPKTMIVMEDVEVKAVGSYTIAEESTGDQSKVIRNFNSISIDVDQKVAVNLSTLEKMVKAIGEFEIYFAPPPETRNLKIKPGEINDEVLKQVRKFLPVE
jgi:hypothetical protein